jgi:L-lactate dehydrogenase complex protein LldG
MEHRLRYFLDNYEFPYTSREDQLESADVGITLCESLIARTGSVMVSSAQLSGRRMPGFMPVHIVLAYTSQIVKDVKDGFKLMKEKYEEGMPSMITFITGPSSTADIEGILVYGAHGPKELFVFLIDDISII